MEFDSSTLTPIIAICAIILLITLIVKIRKSIRSKRSSCPKCHSKYSYPEDFEIISGDLKWENKKRNETKGDFEYEITYKVFYRIVTFSFKCKNCGHEHYFNKKYELYRSDANYSQSDEEELELLKMQIRDTFDREVFENKEIKIANLDY